MDSSKFSYDSPGQLVTTPTMWGSRPAFVPYPLPPEWQFPTDLWPLLLEAVRELGTLEGVGASLPNPLILLRTLTARESIQSSRLEGTYASPRELLLFELQPKQSTFRNDAINDHREVYNYRKALNHGTESSLPLSLRLIRELHEILMDSVRGKEKDPGNFRRVPVGIGVDGRFIPPPPAYLPECLDRFEKYMNQQETPFESLVNCFLLHYQFETIHPFNDGNGRVGRALLALTLQRNCRLTKPWLYMSEYFEKHREEYFGRLFDVSAKGDWAGWVRFCLAGAVRQSKATIARCRKLLTLREDYRRRLDSGAGSVRLAAIVDGLFENPMVQVAELQRRMKVTYPTASKDLEKLREAGILRELASFYPKTYYSPEVFAVAYDELDP